MKTLISILILTATLAMVAAGCNLRTGQETEESAPQFTTDADTVRWEAFDPELDSVMNCFDTNSKTRYLSTFHLAYTIPMPGPIAAETVEENVKVAFVLRVVLPGNACANGTPTFCTSVSSSGETLPCNVSEQRSTGPFDPQVGLSFDINLEVPTAFLGDAVSGGLAIIVETIDPKSTFLPMITSADQWSATYAGETYPLPNKQVEQTLAAPTPINPAVPSCKDCLAEGE